MLDTKPQGFNFDFGTKPTTSDYEEIKVEIHPEIMLGDFAQAYEKELYRRNPKKAEILNVTREELNEYFKGIMMLRILSVHDKISEWREAKKLFIPTWIQFVISRIGIHIDTVRGLKFIPIMQEEYDLSSMLETSDRLRAFIVDGVSMHLDAFPRSIYGDADVMSMAIVDNYVKSINDLPHPISSYVSAFIGAKLEEEAAFKILYRVRYDDISFIQTMLMHEESII